MDVKHPSLFGDYMEMLIQYGFVCMFVAALPLAPLFALCNNIIEIRVDAYKHLIQTKKLATAIVRHCRYMYILFMLFRPVPKRTNTIEPWLGLLKLFTHIGVVTNACVIAFCTNVIDYMVINI